MYTKNLNIKIHQFLCAFTVVFCFLFLPVSVYAASIAVAGTAKVLNTNNSYLNFTGASNVVIDNTSGNFSGYAFADDVGWVAFGTVDNAQGPVNLNLTTGAVTGKAKVINTGAYIDFGGASNVVITVPAGVFSGYAWSDDMGWLNFSDTGVHTSTSLDTTPPSGGSITYTNGYQNSTTIVLTVNDGTDSGSGVNTTSRIVQRKDATLSGGSCGSYGSFATVTTSGTYPTFTDASGTVSSGSCYQYQYLVSDNAGNQATYTPSFTIKIDTGNPTAPGTPSTTTPTQLLSQTWSWLAATDPLSGIANYLWRVTTSGGSPITNDSTSGLSAITNLAEGVYNFFVKTVDNAGNQSTESSGSLTVDTTAPVTTDSGTDTNWHKTAVTVTLSCVDTGSGCAHTYYTTDGTTPTTLSSSGTGGTTTFTISSDGIYTIEYFSVDAANNQESVKTAAHTVKIDTTAPTTPGLPSTTTPTNNNTPTWNWNVSTDSGSGLASLAYTVEWSTDQTFASGVSTSTAATNSFTHSTALSGGTWYFRVKASDAAGNNSSYSSNGSVIVNTSAPSGSISIDNGATYTNINSVLLTLSATDTFDSESSLQIEFSENPTFSGVSYQSFAASPSFTLSSGDGTKTVYVRFKNSAGSESTFSASITLDTTGSVAVTMDSPGDSSYTSSDRPTFRFKPTTDQTSGVSKYILEVDNPSIGSSQPSGDFTIDNIPTSGTTDISMDNYTIHFDGFDQSDTSNQYISVYTKSSSHWGSDENDGKLREGKVTWKVTAMDNAGNLTTSSRTLFVDQTAPNVSVTQIDGTTLTGTNAIETTNQTPTIFGIITDPLSGADNNGQTTQSDSGSKSCLSQRKSTSKLRKRAGIVRYIHK